MLGKDIIVDIYSKDNNEINKEVTRMEYTDLSPGTAFVFDGNLYIVDLPEGLAKFVSRVKATVDTVVAYFKAMFNIVKTVLVTVVEVAAKIILSVLKTTAEGIKKLISSVPGGALAMKGAAKAAETFDQARLGFDLMKLVWGSRGAEAVIETPAPVPLPREGTTPVPVGPVRAGYQQPQSVFTQSGPSTVKVDIPISIDGREVARAVKEVDLRNERRTAGTDGFNFLPLEESDAGDS